MPRMLPGRRIVGPGSLSQIRIMASRRHGPLEQAAVPGRLGAGKESKIGQSKKQTLFE